MPIYKKVESGFRRVKQASLGREKTLQAIMEENLLEMLDMHPLASEYPTTTGGRIDTLAVDSSGAPVIIEYKLTKNEQVINQALSYLKWLMAQKSDFFEMLIHKRLPAEVAKNLKVDWKNPRVVCIAESFNRFDIDTAEVVPLRIELIRYQHYEDGLFLLDPVTVPGKETSLPPVTNPSLVPPGVPPASSPDLETHLAKGSDATRELFLEMRSRIFAWDESIEERITGDYVAYRVTKSFTEVHIQKKKIRFFLRPVDFSDPKGAVTKIPDGYNWTLNRSFYLEKSEDLDYAMRLIEQSYKDVL